jgi:hypothetical protein
MSLDSTNFSVGSSGRLIHCRNSHSLVSGRKSLMRDPQARASGSANPYAVARRRGSK